MKYINQATGALRSAVLLGLKIQDDWNRPICNFWMQLWYVLLGLKIQDDWNKTNLKPENLGKWVLLGLKIQDDWNKLI